MIIGSFLPITVMIAAGLWTSAMHAFSAIPDIDADREAGVSTIATLLGKYGTLIFCGIAYVGSAILAIPYLAGFAFVFGAIFAVMILAAAVLRKGDAVFAIYRLFPVVNASVGFVLFWIVASKFL